MCVAFLCQQYKEVLPMSYSLDTTGQALQNRVVGETQALSRAPGSAYLFILPEQGPLYWDFVEIKLIASDGSSRVLDPETEYKPAFQYLDATAKTNLFICGGIALTDVTLTGTVVLNYRCLGGNYVLADSLKAVIRGAEKRDPVFTTWEAVCAANTIPLVTFPVVDHPWSVTNSAVIRRAMEELEKLGLVVHLRPEFLPAPETEKFIPTKKEIGLGDVENYGIATIPEAKQGAVNDKYMTPLTTKASVLETLNQQLNLIGYRVPIDYAAGLNLTSQTQPIAFDGDVYLPRPNALPFTTSGDFEKDKFTLFISNKRAGWKYKLFTISGSEVVAATGGIVLQSGFTFNCAVKTKLILNNMLELVRTVDYRLDNGTIYLEYPVSAGDELTFWVKSLGSRVPDESPYYKIFSVTSNVNEFLLTGFGFLTADDVRVSLNDLIILTPGLDYTIANGKLTVTHKLTLGDVIEVQDHDSLPDMGVHQLRSLLNSTGNEIY
jgi:hypothetical protein